MPYIWCLLCFDPCTLAGRLSRSDIGEQLPVVDLGVFRVFVADEGAFWITVADVECGFGVIACRLDS